ncbi:phosphotransferase family protein [Campylobacter volucris]|uniref:Phosphotransferase family protein n=1 Tax=Campylobacter volucris TaxID=1031542 RepID=A0A5C7E393_9BACT|nr:choline/ethanolamine kinase family protein [Campylobacter volucris]TXE90065.1 phosphotransferase family protein [Campylobacter volucris]
MKFLTSQEIKIYSIEKIGVMTNQNYLIIIIHEVNLELYCLRLANLKTNRLVNRSYEKYNDNLVSKNKFSVESVYFDEITGVKITKFLNDSYALNLGSIANKDILRQIALKLKEFHESKLEFKNIFNIYEEYFSLLKEKDIFYKYHEKMNYILEAFNTIALYFQKQPIRFYPCHNDLVPENILVKDKIYFIDWEYSGKNDPLWELANFITESRLNDELAKVFLEIILIVVLLKKKRNIWILCFLLRCFMDSLDGLKRRKW